MNPDRHSPNRFSSYYETHQTILNQFIARDFVGRQNLMFNKYSKLFHCKGEIGCLGEIVISVDKIIAIVDFSDESVQTKRYAYNASIRGRGKIFRYDNQHSHHLRPGHLDPHHKHSFNWETNLEEPNSPVWVGESGWPTLGQVLQEAEDWYWENRDFLPNPDEYASIGVRSGSPSLEL